MGRNECGIYHQLEMVSILEGFTPLGSDHQAGT